MISKWPCYTNDFMLRLRVLFVNNVQERLRSQGINRIFLGENFSRVYGLLIF